MRGAIFILCSFILALQTNTAETGRGECGKVELEKETDMETETEAESTA